MSIQEIQGPLSAAVKRTAKQDAVFGNLPDGAKPKRPRKKVAGDATARGPWGSERLRYDGDDFDDIVGEAKRNMNEQGWRGSITKHRKSNSKLEPTTRDHFRMVLGLDD